VLVALAVACAPAAAVIGGGTVDPMRYPYVAKLLGCTGTLIAADRVLTAGHCAAELEIGDTVGFPGGETRHVARLAQDYDYFRTLPADSTDTRPRPHDAALVQLDAPITDIAPVRLATRADVALYAPGTLVTTLGYGITFVGQTEPRGVLHSGVVEIRADGTCRSLLTPFHAADDYNAAAMLCTTDPDAQKPFVSGCNGDSGGPLVAAAAGADLQVGLDDWGVHCGTHDGDPENYADIAAIDAFATVHSPQWAPIAFGLPKLRGTVATGHTVSCVAPHYAKPQPKLTYTFTDGGDPLSDSHSRRFTIRRELRGVHLSCRVQARTRGGESDTGDSPAVFVGHR
jgi:hypothetical protein